MGDILRCWLGNGFNFIGIGCNTIFRDYMPQIFHSPLCKGTFILISKELILSQCLKKQSQVFYVLLHICAINKNIVKENQCKFPEEVCDDGVHESLKCRRCTSQAEWHYQTLKIPHVSVKCIFFWNICLIRCYLVIASP